MAEFLRMKAIVRQQPGKDRVMAQLIARFGCAEITRRELLPGCFGSAGPLAGEQAWALLASRLSDVMKRWAHLGLLRVFE
jgi:hypothetical protein